MAFTRSDLEAQFGSKALGHALFYHHEGSLRFRLSRGGTRLQMFVQAFDKARVLLGPVVSSHDTVVACLSSYQTPELPAQHPHHPCATRYLEAVLQAAEIQTQSKPEGWYQAPNADSDQERHFLLFETTTQQLDSLLWLSLAQDLGIQPRFEGDLYLLWPEQGILAHPYDDRGMDLIGPNKEVLKVLYESFQRDLLEHDLPRMQDFFNALS